MKLKQYIAIARPDYWFKNIFMFPAWGFIGEAIKLKQYIAIARPDHWFKNIFMFPGLITAFVYAHATLDVHLIIKLFVGILSTCLIASANYVINEWLDAEFDRFHPTKKNRPAVAAKLNVTVVYAEYGLLSVAGLGLALLISMYFFYTEIIFLLAGIIYNVKPFRSKEKVYVDVLSESFNNPIRLLLGWFVVTDPLLPPSSLVVGYWMGGAFLMAVKRFAEFRMIKDPQRAGLYRRSFQFYTEECLLVSVFFYGILSALFLGVFMIKNRIELLFSLPFFALLFSWYFYLGLQPNSPTQDPEHLYRKAPLFIAYVIGLTIILSLLLFIDIPFLQWFLKNAFVTTQ